MFFPYKPRATETAQPGLKQQGVTLAGMNGVGKQSCCTGQGRGNPRYLYAVQLLGQDAEKVFGEVA